LFLRVFCKKFESKLYKISRLTEIDKKCVIVCIIMNVQPPKNQKSFSREERQLLEEKYDGHTSKAFERDCNRLACGEPIAYVIGWQPFLGLKIFLDSPCSAEASQGTRPFIPRPETEWWTEQLLSNLEVRLPIGSRTSKLRFLDLCAGSGAIGCAALARLPNAQVYFGEIDSAHEATILKNIRENHLDETSTHIYIGDLFESFPPNLQFDVIVANPPYGLSSRILPRSVTDYEPALALYGGADGLTVIRRIAAELPHRLAKGGIAWIECDETHTDVACALFTAQGLTAEVCADQYGTPRVIVVSLS